MKYLYTIGAVVMLMAGRALAHEGSRFWVGASSGQAATFASDNDFDPSTFFPARVFDVPLEEFFGIYSTDFPGYEVMPTPAAGVPAGTTFGFQLAGPLLLLDGENQLRPADDVLPAPAPRLGIFSSTQSRVTSEGVQNGFNFFNYGTAGDHAHLAYTLFGDGASPGGGDDGAYAVPFRLTATTLTTSEWYILVLSKNATTPQIAAARAYAQQMVNARPGDANFDQAVNLDDFTILAANFGSTGKWWADGDSNFDGAVNLDDFTALASNFGTSPAAVGRSHAVPEPANAGLAATIFTFLTGRRCKTRSAD
jgi:hypothetical protein